MSALVALVLLCLSGQVSTYGTGAPNSACTYMKPGHGRPQEFDSPYSMDTEVNQYEPNFPVTVRVSPTYSGILLQARRTDGSSVPVGTFTSGPPHTRLVTCSHSNDAVTHADTIVKLETDYTWMPPEDSVGDIQFVATIATSKEVYWTDIRSGVLRPTKNRN